MDEADNLTWDAQPALRRIIEDYSDICRFILSCNYPNKIIPPIRDRLVEFRFKNLKSTDMQIMLNNIVQQEDIDISKSAISTLATLSNGSMRKALGVLTAFKMANIKSIDDNMIYDSVYWVTDEYIKNLVISTMKGDWNETDKKLEYLLMKAKLELMPRIADVEYRLSMGASENIQLKYLLIYFIKVFEKYYKRESK